ncbi:hypothetical protein KR200_007178 [Drosophila serrata]|nr:hypothetical protein KR200_007178 [Drosophila serrata]
MNGTADNSEKPAFHEHQPRLNDVAQEFLADVDKERQRLSAEFPLCAMLIDEAVARVYSTGRIPGKEFYADVYQQRPLKITQKVFVPVKQHPNFNFTGKILGPKGNSLRRLQDETKCKISIKGRHSMRDRAKEDQLRDCGDPWYAHLQKDLYLEVSTVATPAESYARMAYALSEIRKYIVPDKNDEVSQEQLREMMNIDPESAKNLIFGKKFGGNSDGAPKFINLRKRAAENPPEVDKPEEVAPKRQPTIF